jgi:cyanophycinase
MDGNYRANRTGDGLRHSGAHDASGLVAGALLIIGGNENKDGHRPILEHLARRAGTGKLVVATMASEEPEAQWEEYSRVFHELGVANLQHLDIRAREEVVQNPSTATLEGAEVIFFTGGDQMKITSRFGGTPLCDYMRQAYARGAMIAGTSSGASVMSEVMMAGGESDRSHEKGDSLRLAPGLGLITGILIDQHFAERGRIGRLTGAISQNPRLLGIGIDEDTAVLIEAAAEACVIGSGAVYLLDGRNLTYTNAFEESKEVLSAFGMTMHVLSSDDRFDLTSREPFAAANTGQLLQ